MTPEQRSALLGALDAGDHVRAVTIALQISATLARQSRHADAMAIRRIVDHLQGREAAEREHRRLRLDIAARLMAGDISAKAYQAVQWADELIAENDRTPIPILDNQ
jgi:hypothetical protein